VIRDDKLPAGTKQRGMIGYLLSKPTGKEFVYAGPVNGYAQVALSYSAKECEKKATLFLRKREPLHPLTERAKLYGGKICQIPDAALANLQIEANNYVKERNQQGVELLAFGGMSYDFIWIMYQQIKRAMEETELKDEPPKRMWCVVGSGTLLTIFHLLFPTTEFLVVQVGKTISPKLIECYKIKSGNILSLQKNLKNLCSYFPPYPSVDTYDAKLWQFVLKYGKSGDYIWNVAS